jgi:hypothetical protein
VRFAPHQYRPLQYWIAVPIVFLAGQCIAGEKEQVELLESAVSQFEKVIGAATKCADLLTSINDGPSAEAALAEFEDTSKAFRVELTASTALAKEIGKQFANARPARIAEYQERGKAAIERSNALQQEWAKQSARITGQAQRIFGLKGLSSQFWDVFDVDIHRLLVALFDFARASGNEPPQEFDTQLRASLAMYEKFGPRKVVRIMMGVSDAMEVANAAAALRKSLPNNPSIVVGNHLAVSERIILVAPVDRIEDVAKAVDFGKVTATDEAQRLIVVRPRSAATTPEEIEAALQILTDNGKFPLDSPIPEPQLTPMTIPGNFGVPRLSQPQNPNRGADLMRTALRELGMEGILTVDLQTDNFQQLTDFESFAYWNDIETGKAFLMVNGRFFLIYRGSVEDFAKHVDLGTVASTDDEKRRVVIKADAEKISLQGQLRYFSGRKDDEIERTRQSLERKIVLHRLEEIAKKQGTKLELHGKDAASMMEELDSSRKNREETNRNAMMDSVRQSIEQSRREMIDDLRGMRLTDDNAPKDMSTEDRDAFNRNIDSAIRNRTMANRIGKSPAELNRKSTAVPIYDLGELSMPKAGNALAPEEVTEVVDMLYYGTKSVFDEDIHVAAIKILLRIPTDDVTDRETRGRIAKGLRHHALENFFLKNDPDVIRGLVKWGGKYSVPILVEMANRQSNLPPEELFQALALFPDPAGAEALAAYLGNDFDETRARSAAALRIMGSIAEDALIKAAPSNDAKMSTAAIELLGEVGTGKSLPILQKAGASRNSLVRELAETAAAKIKERQPAAAK